LPQKQEVICHLIQNLENLNFHDPDGNIDWKPKNYQDIGAKKLLLDPNFDQL